MGLPLALLVFPIGRLSAAEVSWAEPAFRPAPPVAPEILTRAPGVESSARVTLQNAGTLYSIGEPTDEEQLYVEFINRSRANPAAEGRRLAALDDFFVRSAYEQYKVDLKLLVTQFDAIPAAPPVSINAQLTAAARGHTQDLLANELDAHVGSDGSTIGTRVTAAGYPWLVVAENVFSYVQNMEYGHAGFDVDWGFGPGGVQNPPGHRRTIHLAELREVGVGVVFGTHGSVGPQLVTQDFGSRSGLTPFLTGVVYYDFNGNGFYDLGEGIGGVTVRSTRTSNYAVTARSGGYSIPVGGNGTYTVTFDVPGLATVSKTATVAGNLNLKLDHTPTYTPPVLGGSTVAYTGRNNDFAFASVGGATKYEWRTLKRVPWTEPEGAENGLARFTTDLSAGYEPIAQGLGATGTASFHLVHPAVANQYLTLQRPLRLGANPQLTFQSRLGWATAIQTAHVQITTDAGASWKDLWSKAGDGAQGQSTFAGESVALKSYAGQIVQLRFAYTVGVGSYYAQVANGVGWHFDDVRVADAEELLADTQQVVTDANRVRYRPAAVGDFLLQVRANIEDRQLPWGPGLAVSVVDGGSAPPEIVLSLPTRAAGGGWELPFRLEAGTATVFEVHSSPAVTGPWTKVSGVNIQNTGAGTFRAAVPPDNGLRGFLRVVAP